MQGAREHLLAGPALPGQHDARIRRRDAQHLAAKRDHHRALAQHPRQRAAARRQQACVGARARSRSAPRLGRPRNGVSAAARGGSSTSQAPRPTASTASSRSGPGLTATTLVAGSASRIRLRSCEPGRVCRSTWRRDRGRSPRPEVCAGAVASAHRPDLWPTRSCMPSRIRAKSPEFRISSLDQQDCRVIAQGATSQWRRLREPKLTSNIIGRSQASIRRITLVLRQF